jgi:hypothetical protein
MEAILVTIIVFTVLTLLFMLVGHNRDASQRRKALQNLKKLESRKEPILVEPKRREVVKKPLNTVKAPETPRKVEASPLFEKPYSTCSDRSAVSKEDNTASQLLYTHMLLSTVDDEPSRSSSSRDDDCRTSSSSSHSSLDDDNKRSYSCSTSSWGSSDSNSSTSYDSGSNSYD